MKHEPPKTGLGEAFIATIADPDSQDVIADLADAGIDDLLLGDEGVLSKVPLFGDLVKAIRVAGAISNWAFAKKVLEFLLGMKEAKDRHRFAAELAVNPTETREVGEQLILLLERLDDIPKARHLGRLFRAQIEGEMTQREFRLMAAALDRLVMPYLQRAIEWFSPTPGDITDEEGQAFAVAGVAFMSVNGVPGGMKPRITYARSELGRKMVEILTRK